MNNNNECILETSYKTRILALKYYDQISIIYDILGYLLDELGDENLLQPLYLSYSFVYSIKQET